jgi:flavin reductase (DIM6/NTAB) family NADH-FMN oxidoreductase RutF
MERKHLGAPPFCYPQPVFIIAAYDENSTPCAMNAAWGGTSDYKEMTLCLSKGHKTVANLRSRGAFTISMGTADQLVACDYVGVVSGNKVPDKFERAGWHATHSSYVDAPLIDELPLALECRLISYDEGTGILKGEIVNVSVAASVLDVNGKVDPSKIRPITFDPFNNKYIVLGETVGNAFMDGLQLK